MRGFILAVALFAVILNVPPGTACANVAVLGEADGGCVAVAVAGSARGNVAIVVLGSAEGNFLAIAGSGSADASGVEIVINGSCEDEPYPQRFDPCKTKPGFCKDGHVCDVDPEHIFRIRSLP